MTLKMKKYICNAAFFVFTLFTSISLTNSYHPPQLLGNYFFIDTIMRFIFITSTSILYGLGFDYILKIVILKQYMANDELIDNITRIKAQIYFHLLKQQESLKKQASGNSKNY